MHWVVSCQGGELSDASRTTVLSRTFMPAATVENTLNTGHALGFATVAYTVEGVVTDAPTGAEMDFYTELAGLRPCQIDRAEILAQGIFKVIWMGAPELFDRLALAEIVPPQIQAVRTNARFMEFMPAAVSKGSALAMLAARLGIPAAAAVAFGDGDNDIPMFEWAGMSGAMPQGWPEARARARWIAPDGPAETALARGVDLVLRARG
jgi:hypothetical protein